jgi:hypothetical protein
MDLPSIEEVLAEADAVQKTAEADDISRQIDGGDFRLSLPPALMGHIVQMPWVAGQPVNAFIVARLELAMRGFDPPITEAPCRAIDARLVERTKDIQA